ncbi:DUF1819 family protein [Salinibacterium sp. ZJ70]|uniref:DUF1819 family protein n=1 Tax=Salinibacterium sp. ZJ70 TaxID=2708084 RepID=UPI0014210640|nr:DUF1819 family protein [Salinibacterium sp. ZJ70]
MSSNSAATSRYALSFTTGGLLERQALFLAPVYAEHRDWKKVRDIAVDQNLLQGRTRTTGVRLVRETVRRMSALADREIEMLSDATASERGHLMWVAACRQYDLIGEFAEEVLRERFLTLAGTVSHDDYDSFYRTKAMWHEELDAVSSATYKKLRQVLFRMMVEAGLLTPDGAIEPVLLSARITASLAASTPSEVRFFPTRES